MNNSDARDFPELFERHLSSEINRLRLEGLLNSPLADALRDVMSCVHLARMKVIPVASTLCWQCFHKYPLDAAHCPSCGMANANVNSDLSALQQAMLTQRK